MKELRGVLFVLFAVILFAAVASGDIDRLAQAVTALEVRLTEIIRLILLAAALPMLLVGAALRASPFHRQMGARLMAGALTLFAAAALGPLVLHWLDVHLTSWAGRLLGGQP